MSLLAELKTLYCVTLKRLRGADAAARVEAFYEGQAENFDNFRKRLLHGRRELFAALEAPPGGVWVDMGGGTGWNLEQLGPRIDALGKAYIVDFSPSMLKVARRRIQQRGWKNVEAVEADVIRFSPARRPGRRRHLLLFAHDDSRLVRGHRERLVDSEAGRRDRRVGFLRVAEASGRRIGPARFLRPQLLADVFQSQRRVSLAPSICRTCAVVSGKSIAASREDECPICRCCARRTTRSSGRKRRNSP